MCACLLDAQRFGFRVQGLGTYLNVFVCVRVCRMHALNTGVKSGGDAGLGKRKIELRKLYLYIYIYVYTYIYI